MLICVFKIAFSLANAWKMIRTKSREIMTAPYCNFLSSRIPPANIAWARRKVHTVQDVLRPGRKCSDQHARHDSTFPSHEALCDIRLMHVSHRYDNKRGGRVYANTYALSARFAQNQALTRWFRQEVRVRMCIRIDTTDEWLTKRIAQAHVIAHISAGTYRAAWTCVYAYADVVRRECAYISTCVCQCGIIVHPLTRCSHTVHV